MKLRHRSDRHGRSALGWLAITTGIVLIFGCVGWMAYVMDQTEGHERITQQRLERLAQAIAEDGVCVRLKAKHYFSGEVPFTIMVPSMTNESGVDTITEFLGERIDGDTLLKFAQLPLDRPALAEISLLIRYVSPDDPRSPFVERVAEADQAERTIGSPYDDFLDTARIGSYVDQRLISAPFRTINMAIIDTLTNAVLFRRGAMDRTRARTARHAVTIFSGRLSGKPLRIFVDHPHALFTVAVSQVHKILIFLGALFAGFIVAWKAIRLSVTQTRLAQMQMDLVSNITHELNTPIANISLALDTLKRSRPESPGMNDDELWDIVTVENLRLKSSIKKVLDVSLLEGGQLLLRLELHDVHTLLERTLQGFKLLANRDRIDLVLHLRAHTNWIMVDETYLTNAMHALIDNAIKYSGEQAQIVISTSDAQDGILVRFSDNGPGIPEADRELVFEKFYRVRNPDRYAVKGTGIGLYYARQVIQAHHGWVQLGVQTTGTLVELFLPTEIRTNGQDPHS